MHLEFSEGDYVMIRFPPGTIKKLHDRHAGPFKILKKIIPNVYVTDLPSNLRLVRHLIF